MFQSLLRSMGTIKGAIKHRFPNVHFEQKPFDASKMSEIRQRLADREKIRKRACSAMFTIDQMLENGTSFENLIEFHRNLQNLSDTSWTFQDVNECRPAVHGSDRNDAVF